MHLHTITVSRRKPPVVIMPASVHVAESAVNPVVSFGTHGGIAAIVIVFAAMAIPKLVLRLIIVAGVIIRRSVIASLISGIPVPRVHEHHSGRSFHLSTPLRRGSRSGPAVNTRQRVVWGAARTAQHFKGAASGIGGDANGIPGAGADTTRSNLSAGLLS